MINKLLLAKKKDAAKSSVCVCVKNINPPHSIQNKTKKQWNDIHTQLNLSHEEEEEELRKSSLLYFILFINKRWWW